MFIVIGLWGLQVWDSRWEVLEVKVVEGLRFLEHDCTWG